MRLNFNVHLSEYFTADVRDPEGTGQHSWLELGDGDTQLGLFATRAQLELLVNRLEDYLGRLGGPVPDVPAPTQDDQTKGAPMEPKRSKRPDWIVNVVTDLEQGKSPWREVGVGFENDKHDSVTLLLDALPLSGKLVLTRPKERPADKTTTTP